MNGLSSDEHRKLVAMLGRLGSEHDGEVIAAAKAISRAVERNALAWVDVLKPPCEGSNVVPIRDDGKRKRDAEYRPPYGAYASHKLVATILLQSPGGLRDRDIDFLENMVALTNPSLKQLDYLESLRANRFGGGRVRV